MNYNSKNEILNSLTSLDAFVAILKERHTAGYERKERLQEFFVLGRWLLDSCGNCMEIIGEPLDVPAIVDLSEGRELVQGSFIFGNRIMPAGKICPECKEEWSMASVWESRIIRDDEVVSGQDFIGKTFKEFKESFSKKSDASYYIRKESGLRNDKYIDLSKHENYEMPKNKNGWVDVEDSHVIEEGDEFCINKTHYLHAKCLTEKVARQANLIVKVGSESYSRFRNLAGDENCELWIRAELEAAGIRIKDCERHGEVPTGIMGVYGEFNEFEFHRAWTYWIVKGKVPLELAQAMYSDEHGSKYVRVAGHCGCPAPEEPWLTWIDENGNELADAKELEKYKDTEMYNMCSNIKGVRWVKEPKNEGKPYVTNYHIDTLQGLVLYVNTIKAIADKGSNLYNRPEIISRINEIKE